MPSTIHIGRAAPVLVGRTLEQIFLREELAAVQEGRGRLVLLGGEAGIGKTSLARDLCAEASARAIRVLVGSCYDLTNTPPYGPWLDLFDTCAGEEGLPPPPASLGGDQWQVVTDQAALFAEVRAFFDALAAIGPTVVLLEDLHWTDPASLELLRHLASRLRHRPILFLVTYRGEELTRRHPFAVQLPALVREADGLRLDLRRLDGSALNALVAARYRLSGADEARLVAYVTRHSEGNPLFATELLRALQEEALLRPSGEGWVLGELDRIVLPPFLQYVIDRRIDRLGDAVRHPLAMAAMIGHEIPLALWMEVAGLDAETVLAIIERAVDAHLLEADADGTRVRFAHPLIRETLHASVIPPRRQLWHRHIAEALIERGTGEPDAVAYHLQQAGDPRAPEWLVAAADRAQRAYAWLTAAERLRDAATLLADVPGAERTRGRLACRVAKLLRFSDPARAIVDLEVAAQAAGQIGDAEMAAEVRWLRGLLLCYADRFRSGLAEMIAGLEALAAIPAKRASIPAVIEGWYAEVLPGATDIDADDGRADRGDAEATAWQDATLSRFLAYPGYARPAAERCGRCIATFTAMSATSSGARAALAFASHGLGIAHASLGRPEEARAALTRARAMFDELGHHALVAFTLLDELRDVTLTYGAADPAERRRLAAKAEAALDRTGGALRSGVSPRLAWLGCLVLDGGWQEASQILRDLLPVGNACLRREVTGARAVLARHRGDQEWAWDEIGNLLPDGPRTEPGDVMLQEALFLQILAADLCLDAGDLVTAREWLLAHDRWLAWSEGVLGLAEGQIAWARYYRAAGDRARAHAAAGTALELADSPAQPLVTLAAHRLLGEIATAAGDRRRAAEHLATACAYASVCDAPFERALTLLALADEQLRAGLPAEASALLDEVRAICEPLGATPTLARVDALAAWPGQAPRAPRVPAGLTPREVEVLRLLPRGLSNSEIAETLFLSPRTVQSHLSNLYAKLGVGGRVEATAFAISHGLI